MESTRVQLQYLGRFSLAAIPGLLIAGVFWDVASGYLLSTYPILLMGFLILIFGWSLIDLRAYRKGLALSLPLLRASLLERNLSLFCTMLVVFLVQVVIRLLSGQNVALYIAAILFVGVTFAFKQIFVTTWLASLPKKSSVCVDPGATSDLS